MTDLTRRQFNRLTKQRRIPDAALRVFAATGYSGASMEAIAAEAEVSKPTLYQSFGSKEQLLRRSGWKSATRCWACLITCRTVWCGICTILSGPMPRW